MAERQYVESGRHYVVEYLYQTDDVEKQPLELGNPKVASKVHYNAAVSVFDVTSGVRSRIGKPFAGEYTVLGCVEDAPRLLVHQALAAEHRLRMSTVQEATPYQVHRSYDVLTSPHSDSRPRFIGQ